MTKHDHIQQMCGFIDTQHWCPLLPPQITLNDKSPNPQGATREGIVTTQTSTFRLKSKRSILAHG